MECRNHGVWQVKSFSFPVSCHSVASTQLQLQRVASEHRNHPLPAEIDHFMSWWVFFQTAAWHIPVWVAFTTVMRNTQQLRSTLCENPHLVRYYHVS
ncbi:uncharacterized protein BP01DRAFT_142817 [Aspergillus saccharolyticus JOP 1030-1]|uniref:Uncharacterized protein n=1 Tax=Aspergillus saccharolyticus JOP 1030-1 TaxID=1450539 RepID=A0A318ZBB9_9EURO|nr:hypothetical protein BP01DRAFT_142817 [Aspergillus saccharolyticus JOP 1030-1]PYH42003.1 hypothetical protein BP01DRAFT_142817 [Aspergillus saccharolyticus JOP 1030-1]